MKEDLREIIQTSDGSSTIFDLFHNENFHSVHGAISESMHVFIENGLRQFSKNDLSILEIGFGTGLNCLLTVIHKQANQKIIYHSIEKYPLSTGMTQYLNYSQLLNIDPTIFEKINKSEWDVEKELFKDLFVKKINVDLLYFHTSEKYDLIYFDAFSPNVQPELWTAEIFIKLYDCLNENGILTTYSAKGNVKRALRSAGFKVSRIVGPVGKRHMLCAEKKESIL